MRVLVVEDEPMLADAIAEWLREDAHAVDIAHDGGAALERIAVHDYDVVVLDRDLPVVHGDDVCRQVVASEAVTRVLMLTAAVEITDRVAGLSLGADDYLTKPFAFPELFARVRALVRRGVAERPSELVSGDLALDPGERTVFRAGHRIDLTVREFALLEYLMRHPGVAIGRDRLIAHVWDGRYQGDSNIVDVNIRGIRGKIDRPFARHSIETVRGVGYRFVG